MVKKNTSPRREINEYIRAAGLTPKWWDVLKELPSSLIIKHKITGEVKLIDGNPKRLGM